MPCPIGVTAYAGTDIVQDYSVETLILHLHVGALRLEPSSHCDIAGSDFRPLTKILNCCHILCPDRVSVPAGRYVLSNPLGVVGLVSYYPTNYLIPAQPISLRQ